MDLLFALCVWLFCLESLLLYVVLGVLSGVAKHLAEREREREGERARERERWLLYFNCVFAVVCLYLGCMFINKRAGQ